MNKVEQLLLLSSSQYLCFSSSTITTTSTTSVPSSITLLSTITSLSFPPPLLFSPQQLFILHHYFFLPALYFSLHHDSKPSTLLLHTPPTHTNPPLPAHPFLIPPPSHLHTASHTITHLTSFHLFTPTLPLSLHSLSFCHLPPWTSSYHPVTSTPHYIPFRIRTALLTSAHSPQLHLSLSSSTFTLTTTPL